MLRERDCIELGLAKNQHFSVLGNLIHHNAYDASLRYACSIGDRWRWAWPLRWRATPRAP